MDAWTVHCLDCEWVNSSADESSLRHSAVVHGWLRPGHRCSEPMRHPGRWIR